MTKEDILVRLNTFRDGLGQIAELMPNSRKAELWDGERGWVVQVWDEMPTTVLFSYLEDGVKVTACSYETGTGKMYMVHKKGSGRYPDPEPTPGDYGVASPFVIAAFCEVMRELMEEIDNGKE